LRRILPSDGSVTKEVIMTKVGALQDKVAGKTKQVVAEVTGDGKLAEEAKEQARGADREKDDDPLNVNQLT
jgi:hypothetical protein